MHSPQQRNRPDYRYPAIIQLANQQLDVKGGKQLPTGRHELTSNIKLRKVSYLQLLLGTFQEQNGVSGGNLNNGRQVKTIHCCNCPKHPVTQGLGP